MKTTILTTVLVLLSLGLFAQVRINTDGSDPERSAMLEVKSTEKGFLLPRMDSSQLASIVNPAFGLMVFNTTDSTVRFYNGDIWKPLALGIEADINRPWQCGDTIVDARDNRIYTTVQIGNQCWLAENLNYAIGNSWCYDSISDSCAIYGRLYDWSTALTACPAGWHLPSDDEWKILEGTMDSQYPIGDPEWDDGGWRGYDVGKNMKSASGWYNNGNGTGLYGFGALPGGSRYSNGSFYDLGYNGTWWSSSETSGATAWTRHLGFDHDGSYRDYDSKTLWYSVRCLKDN